MEDKTVYQPYIKKYKKERRVTGKEREFYLCCYCLCRFVDFELDAVSMIEFWNLFKETIQDLFKGKFLHKTMHKLQS